MKLGKRTAKKLVLPAIALAMMMTAMYLGSGGSHGPRPVQIAR